MANRLVTQFDSPARRDVLVATPTCCSCCCCLVSTATLATLTAVHVHEVAVAVGAPRARRIELTVAAAVAMPVCLLLIAAVVAALWSSTLVILPAGLVLAVAWGYGVGLLYRLAGHPRPWRPAAVLVAGALLGFALELFTMGFVVYGELAVLLVPPLAGGYLARRLENRRTLPGAGGGDTPP